MPHRPELAELSAPDSFPAVLQIVLEEKKTRRLQWSKFFQKFQATQKLSKSQAQLQWNAIEDLEASTFSMESDPSFQALEDYDEIMRMLSDLSEAARLHREQVDWAGFDT